MSLNTAKVLALLEAAEAALAGAKKLREIIEREAPLGDPASALDNILLMAKPEFVIEDLPGIVATIAATRAYYTPTRLGINRRARAKRERLKRAAHGGSNDNDGSVE